MQENISRSMKLTLVERKIRDESAGNVSERLRIKVIPSVFSGSRQNSCVQLSLTLLFDTPAQNASTLPWAAIDDLLVTAVQAFLLRLFGLGHAAGRLPPGPSTWMLIR